MRRRDLFKQTTALAGALFYPQVKAQENRKRSFEEFNTFNDQEFIEETYKKSLMYNESATGCSSDVYEAMKNFPQVLGQYNTQTVAREQLRQKIAKREGVPKSWVSMWPGSRQFLRQVSTSLTLKGCHLVTNWPEYQKPFERVKELGREVTQLLQTTDYRVDLTEATKVLNKNKKSFFYFSNPNLPFGRYHDVAQIEAFLKKISSDKFVIIDECYIEFIHKDYQKYSCVQILKDHPNVFINRTFSKIYGLASARIGYAICNPNTYSMCFPDRENEEIGLSSISAAIATVALSDQDHLNKSLELNLRLREKISKFAQDNKIETIGDYGNFMSLVFKPSQIDVKKVSRSKFRFSKNHHAGKFYLRISLRNEKAIDAFLDELKKSITKDNDTQKL